MKSPPEPRPEPEPAPGFTAQPPSPLLTFAALLP